ISRPDRRADQIAAEALRARVDDRSILSRPAYHGRVEKKCALIQACCAGRDRGSVVVDVCTHSDLRQSGDIMRVPRVWRPATRDSGDCDPGVSEAAYCFGHEGRCRRGAWVCHEPVEPQSIKALHAARKINGLVERDDTGAMAATIELHQ